MNIIKLTKKQRNKIYSDAIPQLAIVYNSRDNYGICLAIQEVSGYHNGLAPCAYVQRGDFPEFNLFFDYDGSAYFCESSLNKHLTENLSRKEFLKLRELILMFCVEMTN